MPSVSSFFSFHNFSHACASHTFINISIFKINDGQGDHWSAIHTQEQTSTFVFC